MFNCNRQVLSNLPATRELSKKFDADILIYFDEISRENAWDLIELLREKPEKSNLFMVLSTYGGDPHAGYQIMRALQSAYKHITLYLPGPCKSAGTLMAIGAHRLIMDTSSELGPLDIQVLKRDEIAEMGSGLDINEALVALTAQAFEAFKKILIDIKLGAGVSTRVAARMASKMTIGLYARVFSQVDPIRLGEMQRAISITYDYAQRLKTQNVRDDAPSKLVTVYRDHGFVIDRQEACEIFENVEPETPDERALIKAVGYDPKSPESPQILELIRYTLGDKDDEMQTHQ